ncbi:MAG: helix-turn-helix domain-containing protein [Elusimicrobiota bacterium]
MEDLMDVNELATYLKVNPQTIYNWVSSKKLPHVKIGDLLRFNKMDIDDWLKNKSFFPDCIRYKDFEIVAVPYQLADSKEWTLNIRIRKFYDNKLISRNFSGSNTFKSKDEAKKHCYNFGKQVIDGEVKNCTVEDM